MVITMQWPRTGPAAERESGMSTVEVVLLAPVVIFVLLLLAGLALMVNAKGVVGSAAADAARMGSLQRDPASAANAAIATADADLHGSVFCQDGAGGAPDMSNPAPTGFAPGSVFVVTVNCTVNYFGVNMTVTSVGVSPVDLYRQAVGP